MSVPNDETPISFVGTANVDVTSLSQHDASDYRQELNGPCTTPASSSTCRVRWARRTRSSTRTS